jgi:hypothetical protein
MAAFFFTGAFRPRKRFDTTPSSRPEASSAVGPPVPLARDGVPAPAGLATDPLKCRFTGSSINRISRPQPDVLRISPGPNLYQGAMTFFAVSGVFWACVWVAKDVPDQPLPVAFGGIVAFGIGCLMLLGIERHVFDRRRGAYRLSSLMRWGTTIPLSRIRAVQLLTEVPRVSKGEMGDQPFVAYQLNLVLYDPKRPRGLLFED